MIHGVTNGRRVEVEVAQDVHPHGFLDRGQREQDVLCPHTFVIEDSRLVAGLNTVTVAANEATSVITILASARMERGSYV